MFTLDLPELVVIVVVLFLVAPTDLPSLLRRLGVLMGRLQRWIAKFTEGEEQLGIRELRDMLKNKAPGPRGHGSSPEEPLLLLQLAYSMPFDPSRTIQALSFFFNPNPLIQEAAQRLLLLDPVFLFSRRTRLLAATPTEIGEVHHGKELPGWNFLNRMFRPARLLGFAQRIQEIPTPVLKANLERLASLPGIGNLDPQMMFRGEHSVLFESFLAAQQQAHQKEFPPQLTVVPSYRCNWNCSFCFSAELAKTYQKTMSAEVFSQRLDEFRRVYSFTQVNLFGGEPTVFPELVEFCEVLEAKQLPYSLATNGVAAPAEWGALAARVGLSAVTFHLEPDDVYRGPELAHLLVNIRSAAVRGKKIVLRINLTDPGQTDWSFLAKYFELVETVYLSFALTFPSAEKDNAFVPLHRSAEFTDALRSLIAFVCEACSEKEHRLILAKPLPLCHFSPEFLQELVRHVDIKNICEVHENNSLNNLTLNPDGTFLPCMALTDDRFVSGPLDPSTGIDRRYFQTMHELVERPVLTECASCPLHLRGLCQAGCYAHL